MAEAIVRIQHQLEMLELPILVVVVEAVEVAEQKLEQQVVQV